MKKKPWGIFCGVSGVLVFYLTIGIWAVYKIFNQIQSQTSQTASLFDSWWQILLFVIDIICALVFIGSLAMFIIGEKKKKKKKDSESKRGNV